MHTLRRPGSSVIAARPRPYRPSNRYTFPMDLPGSPAFPADAAAMAPLCAVFRRFLKSKDLKYTPERADILNAIIERDGVFEVEQLMRDMQRRGNAAAGARVSKATAYRTIKLLQEAGIINQALFDSKQAHYQLIYGKQPRDYMVCMKTGKHIEFASDELVSLRDRICQARGWEPIGHRFQIYALSPEGRRQMQHDAPGDV